ncbi:phage Gp37/Gp68 family protein [Leisingera sp. HS039]|uniref:DUF5131 family protein n=1 Tax=Leisingera sp. HS039 TaxID=2818496 RepID=UPI001B39FCAD|nr:phage Gp37/Gp68 family protein [Leisingera sp. HS039]MBQ4826598.1 phage Gp37/Gp68 family protein [Leisingera sp. HS039]
MAEQSKIEWTDHTFNPWEGCQKVAIECDHCYAEARDQRFTGGTHWGPKAPRRRTSPQNWRKPRLWQRQAQAFFDAHGRRQRVFCASLADVFDNAVPPAWRDDLWALIRECDQLDWQLLTKRPQNIAKMLPADWGQGWPHVWLGTSAGTQKTAELNIPHLLAAPAIVRFVSAEPLLGPVNLSHLAPRGGTVLDALRGEELESFTGQTIGGPGPRRLHLVICGGESGPKARPMHPDWARSLRDQCHAAGTSFFFKQWGSWTVSIDRDRDDPDWRAEYSRLLADSRYRILNLQGGHGFHGERVCLMKSSPKAAAGRMLDGQKWDGMPRGALAGDATQRAIAHTSGREE